MLLNEHIFPVPWHFVNRGSTAVTLIQVKLSLPRPQAPLRAGKRGARGLMVLAYNSPTTPRAPRSNKERRLRTRQKLSSNIWKVVWNSPAPWPDQLIAAISWSGCLFLSSSTHGQKLKKQTLFRHFNTYRLCQLVRLISSSTKKIRTACRSEKTTVADNTSPPIVISKH